ncbi:MAG: putative molybdenum carrier protein [Planctomycetes bacterium]|nr:putative molybdenum carrier protein [Planctomycetota bacterium]MBU4398340.1 putative molybdenum carrier protein [Planctomycetota bacterium]MCG2685611.1 putative molybdenum carrier protein [Planctomycetales bacterium]
MKIISGGQTGVDRGALDAAIELGMNHGGWCPQGRTAEDGRIPDRYELRETDSSDYPVRTERNVLDGDATLILCRCPLSGGTELTLRLAEQHRRPRLVVDLDGGVEPAEVRRWLEDNAVEVLNVAGPRESQSPGIADRAREFLVRMFRG